MVRGSVSGNSCNRTLFSFRLFTSVPEKLSNAAWWIVARRCQVPARFVSRRARAELPCRLHWVSLCYRLVSYGSAFRQATKRGHPAPDRDQRPAASWLPLAILPTRETDQGYGWCPWRPASSQELLDVLQQLFTSGLVRIEHSIGANSTTSSAASMRLGGGGSRSRIIAARIASMDFFLFPPEFDDEPSPALTLK